MVCYPEKIRSIENSHLVDIGSTVFYGDTVQELAGRIVSDDREHVGIVQGIPHNKDIGFQITTINSHNIFVRFVYVIHPSSVFAPFTDPSKAFQEIKARGGWLRRMHSTQEFLVTGFDTAKEESDSFFDQYACQIEGEWCSLKEMFDNYVFTDGTPFGERIETYQLNPEDQKNHP